MDLLKVHSKTNKLPEYCAAHFPTNTPYNTITLMEDFDGFIPIEEPKRIELSRKLVMRWAILTRIQKLPIYEHYEVDINEDYFNILYSVFNGYLLANSNRFNRAIAVWHRYKVAKQSITAIVYIAESWNEKEILYIA